MREIVSKMNEIIVRDEDLQQAYIHTDEMSNNKQADIKGIDVQIWYDVMV